MEPDKGTFDAIKQISLHRCRGFVVDTEPVLWISPQLVEVLKCFFLHSPQQEDLGLVEVFECDFLHSPCKQEIWYFMHTLCYCSRNRDITARFGIPVLLSGFWVPDENLSTSGTKFRRRTTYGRFRWLQNRNRTWVPVWQIQYQLKDRQWLDCYRTVKKVDNGAPQIRLGQIKDGCAETKTMLLAITQRRGSVLKSPSCAGPTRRVSASKGATEPEGKSSVAGLRV